MLESAITKQPQPESRPRPPKRRAAQERRLSRMRRLRVEPLEDRRLLSVVSNEQGWAFDIGPGDEMWISDVSIDGAGNSLVCGRFMGTVDFDPSAAVSNLTSASSDGSSTYDGFLASYRGDGSFNWVKLVASGSGVDLCTGVVTDAQGYSYVTGSFDKSALVGEIPQTSDARAGFLVKYSPVGDMVPFRDMVSVLQWTATPSNGGVCPEAVAISASGEHLYVGGSVNGTGYFGEGFTIPDSGPFVVKVNSATGLLDWAWGADCNAGVQRIFVDTVDMKENVYVAGDFHFTANLGGDTGDLTWRGGYDVFVAKLTTTLEGGVETAWAQRMGGTDDDWIGDLVVTPDHAALYLTGFYRGQADFGAELPTNPGEAFVAKMVPTSGDTLWVKSVGGLGIDSGHGIAAGSADDVYIAGRFTANTDLDPGPNAVLVTPGGPNCDGFVLQLNGQGMYQRAWQLGKAANSNTSAEHVAIQGGNLYVAGRYQGTTELPQGTLSGDPEQVSWFLSTLRTDATVPQAPTAHDDSYNVWKGYPLSVSKFQGVLFNDENPHLSSLRATISSVPSKGTVNLQADGSFEYTPVYGSVGEDQFDYTVDNGQGGTDTGTVYIQINELAPVTFASVDAPKDIIDRNYYVTTSQLVLDSPFIIDDLNVAIDITHPRTPDLDVFLVSPQGTRVELFTDVGTTKSANFTGTILDDDATKSITKGTAPFKGSFQPEGKLSTFKNEPVAGTWTLEICDDQYKMVGTLNSWSLTVMPAMPSAPLHADEVGHNDAVAVLSHAEAQSLLAEALTRWRATGIDTSSLSGLSLQIGDLGGTTLGLAANNTIWLDDDAAGWGWFVDHTPGSDSEFTRSGNQGEQDRMDLLTVVMHELGHLLGSDHASEGVMSDTLAAGVRLTVGEGDHVVAVDDLFRQADSNGAGSWLGAWLSEESPFARPWIKRRR